MSQSFRRNHLQRIHFSQFVSLTQRDWSLMRLMNNGDSFERRTSGEVELETVMKHSAHAFLMPQRLSEHRLKNFGICVKNIKQTEIFDCREICWWGQNLKNQYENKCCKTYSEVSHQKFFCCFLTNNRAKFPKIPCTHL